MGTGVDILYVVGENRDERLLRWSLRSVRQFAEGVGRIVVAGYPPAWLSDSVVRVECRDDEGDWGKHHDIMRCIMEAVSSGAVTSRFLYSSDDHFFVRPVFLPDYPVYVQNGGMPSSSDFSRSGISNRWAESCAHTRELLFSHGYACEHFSGHYDTWMFAEDAGEVRDLVAESERAGNALGLEPTDTFLNVHLRHSDMDAVRATDVKLKSFGTMSDFYAKVSSRPMFSVSGEVLRNPEFVTMMDLLYPGPSVYEEVTR